MYYTDVFEQLAVVDKSRTRVAELQCTADVAIAATNRLQNVVLIFMAALQHRLQELCKKCDNIYSVTKFVYNSFMGGNLQFKHLEFRYLHNTEPLSA